MKLLLTLLLISSSAFADQYDSALEATKRGLLISTGVQAKIDGTLRYAEMKAQKLVIESGLEYPIDVTLFAYRIYKTNNLTIPVAHNKKVSLTPDTIALSWNINL